MDGGKELILSERLLAIAQWIRPGSRVADIGTDHGYLPIWLLQHGRATFIAACDMREGPLEHARRSLSSTACRRNCRSVWVAAFPVLCRRRSTRL